MENAGIKYLVIRKYDLCGIMTIDEIKEHLRLCLRCGYTLAIRQDEDITLILHEPVLDSLTFRTGLELEIYVKRLIRKKNEILYRRF